MRRAFAGVDLAALDPFIHMDQMGSVEWEPGAAKGTSWHPHRGFETVTYLLDGVFRHEDSNGGGGTITDGDTQWMTAGGGILHIEAPPEEVVARGGTFHGVQLWVNLPSRLKMTAPRYQDIRGGEVALLASHDGGALLRVIAGEVAGHQGPGITHTPIALLARDRARRARSSGCPGRPTTTRSCTCCPATARSARTASPLRAGQLAVLGAGDVVTVAADAAQDSHTPALDVLVLGGLPIREPVAAYGPFVMNTRAELQQAYDDFNAGRLGKVPAEPHPGHGPSARPGPRERRCGRARAHRAEALGRVPFAPASQSSRARPSRRACGRRSSTR